MKITESISSLITKGNEELKKFEVVKFLKGVAVLSTFSLAMVYSLRGRADNYYNDNDMDKDTQTKIINNKSMIEDKKDLSDVKIEDHISTGYIIKLMNKKGNEDLLSVAKSDFLSPDSYEKISMHDKYKELNELKTYTKFSQSKLLDLEDADGYEKIIKSDKNVFSKKENEILEKEKRITYIKIENLKRLNDYLKEKTLNDKEIKLKKETKDLYVEKLEEQKNLLKGMEKTIFKIGHFNFGSQMRSLEFLNNNVLDNSFYTFNIKDEILDFEVAFKNKPILKEKTDELIAKMTNIINKNSLNGKTLSVNDKNYLTDSINLLKDMKKDIQNVDNGMEVSSYVSKLNQLDKNIGIKSIEEIQYSKNIETNGMNY